MVDLQRQSHDRKTKLALIIETLKQQSQCNTNNYVQNQINKNDLYRNKNSSRNVSLCANKVYNQNKSDGPKTQSNITDYFPVVKTSPDGGTPTSSLTIKNVLHTLKTNKENSIVTIFDDGCSTNNVNINLSTRDKVINSKIGNGRQPHCEINSTSIKKTCNDNKRLKSDNDSNQLDVADFFNVDHFDNSKTYDKSINVTKVAENVVVANTAPHNIYFDKQVKESQTKNKNITKGNLNDTNFIQSSTNYGSSSQSGHENIDGKIHVFNSSMSNYPTLRSNRKSKKTFDGLKNFKRKSEREICMKRIYKDKNSILNNKEHLHNVDMLINKKGASLNRQIHNKTTFDDFCNNIVTTIGQNSTENRKTETGNSRECSHPATHFLPKSYSTGMLIVNSQRTPCSNQTSLPITDIERKNREEKLVEGKISFDDFVENILKDFNGNKSNDDHQRNIEIVYNSEETSSFIAEDKKNKIKDLLGSLKSAKKCFPTANTTLSKGSYEETYQYDSENVPQETNTTGCKNLGNTTGIANNVENLESVSALSTSCDDTSKNGHDLKSKVTVSQNVAEEASESEDFLSYLPNYRNVSNQVVKGPYVELLTTQGNNLPSADCNDNNSTLHEALPILECPPLDIYNKILQEVPQDNAIDNVNLHKELINEKRIGHGEDSCTHCTYGSSIFTESNNFCIYGNNQSDENIREQLHFVLNDMLQNNLLNGIVLESDQVKRNTEKSGDKTEKLDDLLGKLLKQNTISCEINHGKNKVSPTLGRIYIKRYRKGKTKIYRLKKLVKRSSKTEVVEAQDENLNFNDVFQKLTQDNIVKNSYLLRSQSMSSISTSSSYVTDVTTSEIMSTGSSELSSPKQRLRKGFNELCEDKSLLYCEEKWENTTEYDKEEIKMKIQDIVLKVVEDFTETNGSSLKYRKQSFDNCIFKDGRLQLKPMAESSMTVINSKAQRSQSKFTLILYLMKKIQTLLETDTKLTKRELYYQLKTLIKDQQVTDRAINAISCLLDVGMWALNIVAQKGLVFGNLKILLSSGETLNCNIPGTLIPQDINDIVEIASPAYFILVVEKESIFHKLIGEDLPNRLTRPFIMITGKGFPDLNTQLFLKKLWMIMSIPVFILVDADPHGINIMLNYRFGSVNNAHVSHLLAVPNAKWLGVYPSEVINLNIARELLSERELKLVNHLLKTPYMDCNPRIADELKVLLETKCKAEIEGLIKSDTYLSEVYLPNKFFTHNFI